MNLSGVCIFNSQFNLVYVEGGAKFIRQYKRLMLHRIAWTDAARPRGGEAVEQEENADAEEEAGPSVNGIAARDVPAISKEAEEEDNSLQNNKCWLIWEGLLRDRVFNTFRAKSCPTDRDAKEFLGEKLRGYWDQAKNWKPEEEVLF